MEQINITTPEKTSGIQKINIEQEQKEKKFTLSLKEADRLLFAKQVLLFIFFFSVIIVVFAAFSPTNELIVQMVDLVKIGVLPLVTLIVSFYFPQNIKDKNSN
ncbi:hypothetical protein [Escherichia coli]|uniref:hypothetical protein n=1 Tax=Escherichia coli TaxID=562 RepID=UPI0027966829|nr:hypothetical protein [Escherichia coli]MDQ1777138.1 hypothetical protein [Escherichia coli]